MNGETKIFRQHHKEVIQAKGRNQSYLNKQIVRFCLCLLVDVWFIAKTEVVLTHV